MRAYVQDRYGPISDLRVVERDRPVPGGDQALIRVAAAGVDPSIWHLMTGTPYAARAAFGLRRPRIPVPGWDAAGIVEEVGAGVTALAPGDRVFGSVRGSFAELAVGSASNLVPLPDGVRFAAAATLATSGVTALQAVRDSAVVTSGDRVLILGAGGGVGVFATQLAVRAGAQVTGVCSRSKIELVRGLGSDEIIDYTVTDIGRGGETDAVRRDSFQAIIDTAGGRPVRTLSRLLAPGGTLVIVGAESRRSQLAGMGRNLRAAALSPFSGRRLRSLMASVKREDLVGLIALVASGDLRVPIDRVFAFEQAVEAITYVRENRSLGKVVVQVDSAAELG